MNSSRSPRIPKCGALRKFFWGDHFSIPQGVGLHFKCRRGRGVAVTAGVPENAARTAGAHPRTVENNHEGNQDHLAVGRAARGPWLASNGTEGRTSRARPLPREQRRTTGRFQLARPSPPEDAERGAERKPPSRARQLSREQRCPPGRCQLARPSPPEGAERGAERKHPAAEAGAPEAEEDRIPSHAGPEARVLLRATRGRPGSPAEGEERACGREAQRRPFLPAEGEGKGAGGGVERRPRC